MQRHEAEYFLFRQIPAAKTGWILFKMMWRIQSCMFRRGAPWRTSGLLRGRWGKTDQLSFEVTFLATVLSDLILFIALWMLILCSFDMCRGWTLNSRSLGSACHLTETSQNQRPSPRSPQKVHQISIQKILTLQPSSRKGSADGVIVWTFNTITSITRCSSAQSASYCMPGSTLGAKRRLLL